MERKPVASHCVTYDPPEKYRPSSAEFASALTSVTTWTTNLPAAAAAGGGVSVSASAPSSCAAGAPSTVTDTRRMTSAAPRSSTSGAALPASLDHRSTCSVLSTRVAPAWIEKSRSTATVRQAGLAYDARWIIVGADGAGAEEEEDMARGQGWRGAGGRRRAAEDEAPRETGERTKGRRATKEAAALREKARRANVSSVAELVLRAQLLRVRFAKPRVAPRRGGALAARPAPTTQRLVVRKPPSHFSTGCYVWPRSALRPLTALHLRRGKRCCCCRHYFAFVAAHRCRPRVCHIAVSGVQGSASLQRERAPVCWPPPLFPPLLPHLPWRTMTTT